MKRRIRLVGWALVATTALGVIAAQAEDNAGNLRYSITVSKFKNEASWSGRWDVGNGFTALLIDALQQSGKFIVLADAEMRDEALREQDLAATGRMAGGKKAPKIGRMTPAQLLVRGSVTHVQSSTAGAGGGLSFKGIRIGGKGGKGEVNITMYLVDSETGQVRASTEVIGTSGKRGVSLGYHGPKLGGLTGDLAGFTKDNVGKACLHAVEQGVEFLGKQLEDVPWEGSIVLAKPDKVIINRGSREGVAEGMTFTVGSIEEIVDPDTGEVLNTEMTAVGKIEVTAVKEKIAYCKAIEGADKIEKGMTINP